MQLTTALPLADKVREGRGEFRQTEEMSSNQDTNDPVCKRIESETVESDTRTGERVDNDPGSPVIVSRDALRNHAQGSPWEPGIVEVEFKEAPHPEHLALAASASPVVAELFDANLTGLREIFQRHRLESYAPSLSDPDNAEHGILEGSREEMTRESSRRNFMTFYFPPDADTVQIAKELRSLKLVERAVPVPKAVPASDPADEPRLGNSDQVGLILETQWYIFRTRTNLAWKLGTTGKDVVIADIDFGFRVTHQDLRDRIKLKHNAYDGSEKVSQGDGTDHGTATLGLAGAAVNGLGIAGVAFGADLWAIQANTGTGPRPRCNPWARAIDFVRRRDSQGKRKVILVEIETLNGGNYEMVPSVNKAIRDAIESDIVVCVAAGNGGDDAELDLLGDFIPVTNSILVGATAFDPLVNPLAHFSNHGPRIVVSAPGSLEHDVTCGIRSDDNYRSGFGGTSGAAAKVAGAVALMLEKDPKLSHNEVREILITTGTDVFTDPSRPGGKFLNVEAAVVEADKRAHASPLVLTGQP